LLIAAQLLVKPIERRWLLGLGQLSDLSAPFRHCAQQGLMVESVLLLGLLGLEPFRSPGAGFTEPMGR
jgi:hypothetical protein